MRGPVFVLHCLIRLCCCIICATGRQLLRPAMSGSRASRAKENVYKTVPKNAANGKLINLSLNQRLFSSCNTFCGNK